MTSEYRVTYADGPQLSFTNALSGAQFAALCRALAQAFAAKAGETGDA